MKTLTINDKQNLIALWSVSAFYYNSPVYILLANMMYLSLLEDVKWDDQYQY